MTGWTWEQVRREMTIPRLQAMQRQWSQHPPTHILVAGYLGYKAEPEEDGAAPALAPAKEEKAQDLGELIQIFGSIQGGIVQHG